MMSESDYYSMRTYLAIAKEISLMNEAELHSLTLPERMQLKSIIKKLEASRKTFSITDLKSSFDSSKRPALRLLQAEQF